MTPVTKPLWQRFLIFLLPLMLSNILQSLSGTINNIYVGQLIGVDALASASVPCPMRMSSGYTFRTAASFPASSSCPTEAGSKPA